MTNDKLIEEVAREFVRCAGVDPDDRRLDGEPLWTRYVDEAKAAIATIRAHDAQSTGEMGDIAELEKRYSNVYNWLTKKPIINLCGDLLTALRAEKERVRELEEALVALEELVPFELVTGDTIRRLQPHSQVNLNSNTCWAVSSEIRPAHKLRAIIETINNIVLPPTTEGASHE